MGFDMRKKIELKVHLAHDEEAGVWFVAESDIPGLRLEADNPIDLMRRIAECAGELIELNEAEIIKNHVHKTRPSVSLMPVFDSPLDVAYAC